MVGEDGFMKKRIINSVSILILTILSVFVIWHEAKFGLVGANNYKRLALIPALYLAQINKHTLRVAFILLVLYAFYSITALTYGGMKIAYFVSVLETNSSEGFEFFTTLPIINYVIALIFIILSFVYYKTASIIKMPHWAYSVFAIALFIFTTILSWPGTIVRQATAMGKEYFEARQILIDSVNKPDSWKVQNTDLYGKYDNYVLVIGESVRKDYLSVYGYEHTTTPWLDQVHGTFIDGYVSMGFNTVSSLSRTLTQSLGDGMSFIPENNIITLANKGGYDTSWISNQGMIGEHDTSTSTVAIRANKTFFMNQGSYSDKNTDDNDMLPHLRQILNSKNASADPKLTVLHMLGSHPDTCSRLHDFPNNFNLEYGKRFNCYLATLEKTDDFLRQVTETLSEHGSYSLIYLSDHGMNVNSKTVHVDGTIKNAYEVPFFVINSDDSRHLKANRLISGFNFTDIFANWLGLTINENSKLYDIQNINEIPEPKHVLSNYSGAMINPLELPEQEVLQ